MMIAHTLEFTVLAIQEETLISYDFYAADAETGSIFIRLLAIGIDFRNCLI